MAHPVPPAAAVPPLGPVAGPPPEDVPVPPARTYRELYSDVTNNPTPARTAGYLSGYRFADAAGGGVPTPAALRDQTITLSDRQPMAFLALGTGQDGQYEVVVLHRLLKYMDLPGDDPSGYHDHVLGLVGDIMPHQYPTVEVPNTVFHLVTTAVRIPTIGAMTALLPTWDDTEPTLGPYIETDPETEVVRPRYVQVVPGRYAAMLVDRRRVRPKQAYMELVGEMQARHEIEACQDVVTWLRAACTARGGGGAQNAIPSVHSTLAPVHLPPEVYRYVTTKVQGDLPALQTGGPGGGPGAEAFAGALRALGTARGGTADVPLGEDGARAIREMKTIADTYKETYHTLLRFCNVTRVDEVAPLWIRIANCLKSEQHVVLTQELQKICMSRGLSTELYVPVITATVKQMVVGFQFAGHGSDDLGTGCQPFVVAYSGSANHYQALAAASVSNQLSQGDQAASLSDYRTIRETEKIKFPRDVNEVTITLMRYAVLCQCLFQGVGAPHPFVETMWALATGMQNSAPFIAERYNNLVAHPGITSTYYARIIRAVQLSTFDYLQQVAISVGSGVAGVEQPSFHAMMQDLRRGTFHLSTNWIDIPATYLEPLVVTASVRTASGGSVPTGVSTTGASSIASVRTGVSGLTTEGTPRAMRVDNPNPDTEFTSMTLRAGGSRVVLRQHPPPRNDAGNEFCVAWWTRGGCFPNCGRRTTHANFASPAERTRLLGYVREHLQAPAAAPT